MAVSSFMRIGMCQALQNPGWKRLSSQAIIPTLYHTLTVKKQDNLVAHVQLNRPEKLNAMNETLWREIHTAFSELAEDPDCRCIVLSGAGRIFSSGLDLGGVGGLTDAVTSDGDVARKNRRIYANIRAWQDSFSSLEKCPKPVIAAVHGACVGAGVDLIAAADVRYCTNDAWFQIKEVDLGLAADVGTLQRFPKIVGNDSLARELAFSARKLHASKALQCGLVSEVFEDRQSMDKAIAELASEIAAKSPVAVQGTKVNLNYSRDHTVQESLEYQAVWNMSHLQSEDLMRAASALLDKSVKPVFANL